MPRAKRAKVAQAWIELLSDDPEAVSALGVARAHLTAARGLASLRRVRLVEVSGALPQKDQVADLLHRSTQFYNPHKERCAVRLAEDDPAPLAEGERAVLVEELGGSRREGAERWWQHETGQRVDVREGVAWVARFDAGADGELEDLVLVRGRRHGLLCNPHSQDYRVAEGPIPVPWLEGDASQAGEKRTRTARGTRSRA